MMNPYLSWAILLVVAGGLGWYYNGPTVKTPVKPAVIESPESAVSAKKPKRKTARKEISPEPAPTKAEERKQPAVEKSASQDASQNDEEIDNKELAERFAAVKSGAVPAPAGASKSQKKKKSKKTTSAGQLESPSTTGAEADDDLSSTGSPVVNPTVPAAGYVSDMLEEPAPSASVLRVTGSVESQQPKKQKPQSFKQVETKKQRQQRVKNESRKEQVQAAEGERRKLLEKQLHTARESERREAAKTKPAASTTNAWQPAQNVASATNGASKAAPAPASAPAAKVELLDTFDHDSSPAKPAVNGSSNKWSQALPSEEEQMRMLNASNPADEWTTVSTKAKKQPKKKGTKGDESQSEASASESNQPAAVPAPAEPKVTVTPTYLPDILRSKQKGHPMDSDWAA